MNEETKQSRLKGKSLQSTISDLNSARELQVASADQYEDESWRWTCLHLRSPSRYCPPGPCLYWEWPDIPPYNQHVIITFNLARYKCVRKLLFLIAYVKNHLFRLLYFLRVLLSYCHWFSFHVMTNNSSLFCFLRSSSSLCALQHHLN